MKKELIGKGETSTVYKVQYEPNGTFYGIKEILLST